MSLRRHFEAVLRIERPIFVAIAASVYRRGKWRRDGAGGVCDQVAGAPRLPITRVGDAGQLALRIDPGIKCNQLAPAGIPAAFTRSSMLSCGCAAKLFHGLRVGAIGYVELDVSRLAPETHGMPTFSPRQIVLEFESCFGVRRKADHPRQALEFCRPGKLDDPWVTGSVPGTNIRLGVLTSAVSKEVMVLKRV